MHINSEKKIEEMGLNAKDIPVCLCRMIQVSMETSFIFMRRHPLISGVLILLIIVYLFLSYIYHFLVYLSPFLVCTAIFVTIFWSSEHDHLKYIKRNNKIIEQRKFDRQYTQIPSKVKRDLALERRYSLRNATSRRRNFKDKKWNAQDIVVEETNKVLLPTITSTDSEDNKALSTITSNDSDNNNESSTFTISNDSDENKEATSSDPEPPTSGQVKSPDLDQPTSRTDGSDGSALEKEKEKEEGRGESQEEEGEESHEVEEEEEDSQEETNKAVEWTNDDQKNLMDLGISEIERNRRLESLIARRRVRQHLKLQIEKGLIDLRTVSPSQIAPLLITRINTSSDYRRSEEYEGIEIPGSAPSVLRPSRNPFDLPYDPSEEKPNLTGDSFQQEFTVSHHHREMSFCRHESFNIGPSLPFDESYPFFINGRKISDKFRRLPEKGDHDLIIEKLFSEDGIDGCMGFSTGVKAPKPLLTKLQLNDETPKSQPNTKPKFDMVDIIIKRKQEEEESKPMSDSDHNKTDDDDHDDPMISNDEKARVSDSEAPSPNEKFLNFPITTSSTSVSASMSESLPFESLIASPSSSKNQENVLFSDRCIFHKPTCSIASDLQVEFSEVGSPTTLTIDDDGESVVYDGDGDIDITKDFGEDIIAEVSNNSSSKSIASLIPLQQIDEEEDYNIFCNDKKKDHEVEIEASQPSNSSDESLSQTYLGISSVDQTQQEMLEERQNIPENSRTDSTTIDTQDLDRNEDPGPSMVNRALIDAVSVNPFSIFSPRSVLPEKILTDQVSLPTFDQHIRTNVPQLNIENITQTISTNDLVPNTMPHDMQPLMVDPITQTQNAASSNSQEASSSTVADDYNTTDNLGEKPIYGNEDERENYTLIISRNKEPYDPPEESNGKANISGKENDVEKENSNNKSRKVVDDEVPSSPSKLIEKIGNSTTTTIEDDAKVAEELAQSMHFNPPKPDKLNDSLEVKEELKNDISLKTDNQNQSLKKVSNVQSESKRSDAEIINKEENKEESRHEVLSKPDDPNDSLMKLSNVQSESEKNDAEISNKEEIKEKLSNVQSESRKNDTEMSNNEEDKNKSKNEVPLKSDKPNDSSEKENDAVICNKEDEEKLKNGENSKDKITAELYQEEVNNVHSNSGKNDAEISDKEEDKEMSKNDIPSKPNDTSEKANEVQSDSQKNDGENSNKEEIKEKLNDSSKKFIDDKKKDNEESIEQELNKNEAMASSKEPGEEAVQLEK